MKIEIFPSASGDCLLVTSRDGKRLLADAGLPDAFDKFISAPLARLREAGQAIDVAYVSHIDRDHIGGVLRMLDHEVQWRAFEYASARGRRLRQPKVPRPPVVEQIWHNAFLETIEQSNAVDIGAALGSSADILSGLTAGLTTPDIAHQAAEVRMLSLSVGDAIEVNWRIGRDQLNIPLNPDFDGGLMTARVDDPITLGSLSIKVLGPTATELRELRKDWNDWLAKKRDYIEELKQRHKRDSDAIGSASPAALARLSRELALAVEKDVTPPNLASLVLLVEEDDGRRLLLTGDAGDETLMDYLEAANLFGDDGQVEFDVLKVPHHGAHNSYSPEFVRRVRAQHYVFCGDGEHNNPEPEVVAGYIAAVRAAPLENGRKATFWFNWSLARASHFTGLWQEVEGLFAKAGVAAVARRRSLRPGQSRMLLNLS